jgi:hypothetical protein
LNVFQGWSDEAVRGYIVMLEERSTVAFAAMLGDDEKRLTAARQELQIREHRARLAQAQLSGSR